MTEYIEREALIDEILSEPPDAHYPSWFADIIKKQPTADVVPRAELEHILAEVREAKKLYVKDIARAKAEVAREIFEEIENKFFGQIDEDSGEGILCIYAQDYYEDIKKKYTEETT